jgi:hypothetical protein
MNVVQGKETLLYCKTQPEYTDKKRKLITFSSQLYHVEQSNLIKPVANLYMLFKEKRNLDRLTS